MRWAGKSTFESDGCIGCWVSGKHALIMGIGCAGRGWRGRWWWWDCAVHCHVCVVCCVVLYSIGLLVIKRGVQGCVKICDLTWRVSVHTATWDRMTPCRPVVEVIKQVGIQVSTKADNTLARKDAEDVALVFGKLCR